MSNDQHRTQRLERALEIVATEEGDITPTVVSEFFDRFPGARRAFENYPPSRVAKLEKDMVDFALYSLMYWFERPAEIEIMFGDTVPHHEYLNVPAEHFFGLLDVVLDVMKEALPSGEEGLIPILDQLRDELNQAVAASAARPG